MMRLSDEDAEKQLQEEMERAVRLEADALEKFKREKLQRTMLDHNSRESSPLSNIFNNVPNNILVNRASDLKSSYTDSPPAQIMPRPRSKHSGCVNRTGTSGLVPPPIPKRKQAADSNDLINLKLPVTNSRLQGSLLDQLDLACPNLNNSNMRTIQNPAYFARNFSSALPKETVCNYPSLPLPSTVIPKVSSARALPPLPAHRRFSNHDLIDLAVETPQPPSYNILSAFDPLLSFNEGFQENGNTSLASDQSDNLTKEKSQDFTFDQDDPFEYILGMSQIVSEPNDFVNPIRERRETIYEVLSKEQSPIKPPSAKKSVSTCQNKELSLQVQVNQVSPTAGDVELLTYVNLVRNLRSRFTFDDSETNLGFVVSPKVDAGCSLSTSVKMVVHIMKDEPLINFTCDISIRVDHVISHVICELGSNEVDIGGNYVLKVWGMAEYLSGDSCLRDYEYVHRCIKLEQDVKLCLLHIDEVPKPVLRTAEDDVKDLEIKVEDLVSREPGDALTYNSVCVLLETIHSEIDRVVNSNQRQHNPLVQAVKALCSLLGFIETTDLTAALERFISTCKTNASSGRRSSRPQIVGEDGPYSYVVLPGQNRLVSACADVVSAIRRLMISYTNAFRVDFHLDPFISDKTYDSSSVLDCINFRVCALHRSDAKWNYDRYEIQAELYHGIMPIAHNQFIFANPDSGKSSLLFPNRILFDQSIVFYSVALCALPRESRLVLTLYGRKKVPESESGTEERIELGWTSHNFFRFGDPCWILIQGGRLLPLWSPVSDKRSGHVPNAGRHPRGHSAPLLSIELQDFDAVVQFPRVESSSVNSQSRELSSLDDNTQQTLMDIVASSSFSKMDLYQRELLWEKRHYLTEEPGALAKILHVAQSWDWASLPDLYWMLHHWQPLSPLEALQLLLPCFGDVKVRQSAVEWLRPILSDELVDYLPQLVEALKLEPFDHSPLMVFLLERSLASPQVAHALYWLLVQQLPGPSPQNSDYADAYDHGADPRYSGRLQLLLRSLLATCGTSLRMRFLSEQMLVQQLDSVADLVKTTKESSRLSTLWRELEPIHCSLESNPTSLPIGLSVQVKGVDVRSCGYFPSYTLPLKLAFRSAELEVEENSFVNAMYKVGDDLRQDMLTLQMVRIMDKLWLKNGLDLKMVTFACVPTGPKTGFVKLITGAETLRRIQVEHGLTGSFKDRPISDWLVKHNPSPLDYERAVHNFTASCAGYSVATYVFGVCDRHNDNIMVKSTGHLFHIDFGKFLGDAQRFGSFKRDRTPFVFTSDMAYVINGGDKPSQKFQHFVDLCCQAFNIVRQHSNALLHLLALMATSGIPGVNANAISYVQKALLPDKSKAEAAAIFARMIEDSLHSWFTQFNFFLHNLAQLRFHGDHNNDQLLSFVPMTYTMNADGRITEARVVGYQKRYDPEKYYVYFVHIQREKQVEKTYLCRSFREFSEFHQKLCCLFPLVSHLLPSLSKGRNLGRSSVKVVAEKRRSELDQFLLALFGMAEEICHCDLVYTFFHSLLRDQEEETNVNVAKWRNKSPNLALRNNANGSRYVQGQLKISIQYTRGELNIMIQHGRDLTGVESSSTSSSVAGTMAELPSPYVKTYLLPDMHKITKRKTRVIKKNTNPTFMEMLVYRLPLQNVQNRLLQVSVWSYDRVQENSFLGAVNIPLESLNLTQENVDWYPLGNLHQ